MAKLKWGKPSLFQKAPVGTPLDATKYVKTEDAALEAGKTYYTQSGDTYTAVASPSVGSIATYYERVSAWIDLPTPKEGTLQLTMQDGQESTAVEEGGEIVDIRYGKNTYQVEWDEFDLDKDYCFDDIDGVVAEETSLRWLPEDNTKKGTWIPRAKVRVSTSFNVADGSMRKNTLKVLKPADYNEATKLYSLRQFKLADIATSEP